MLAGFAVLDEHAAHQEDLSERKPSCSSNNTQRQAAPSLRVDLPRVQRIAEALAAALPLPSCSVQVREGEAPAFYNAMEAAAVADLASGVLQQAGSRVAANDLGVIATYRKQARRLENRPPLMHVVHVDLHTHAAHTRHG